MSDTCANGHPWSDNAIWRTVTKEGHPTQRRYCRACKNERQRKFKSLATRGKSVWLGFGERDDIAVDGMPALQITPVILSRYYDERVGAYVTRYAAPWESPEREKTS